MLPFCCHLHQLCHILGARENLNPILLSSHSNQAQFSSNISTPQQSFYHDTIRIIGKRCHFIFLLIQYIDYPAVGVL